MKEKTVQVQMTMPKPPKGFEYTGEFRQVLRGDYYIDDSGYAKRETRECSLFLYHIVRRVWWSQIPEQGILCWVYEGTAAPKLAVVTSYTSERFYVKSLQRGFEKAVPVKKEELDKYIL